MPAIKSAGANLFYEDTGTGPAVLLSHTWQCDGRQWPQALRHKPRVRALVLADTSAAPAPWRDRATVAALGRLSLTRARDLAVEVAVTQLFGPTARRHRPELGR